MFYLFGILYNKYYINYFQITKITNNKYGPMNKRVVGGRGGGGVENTFFDKILRISEKKRFCVHVHVVCLLLGNLFLGNIICPLMVHYSLLLGG